MDYDENTTSFMLCFDEAQHGHCRLGVLKIRDDWHLQIELLTKDGFVTRRVPVSKEYAFETMEYLKEVDDYRKKVQRGGF